MSIKIAIPGFFTLYVLSNLQAANADREHMVRVAECRVLNFGRFFHRLPYWMRPLSYRTNHFA